MTDIDSLLPTAMECMQTNAVAEAKKATEYVKRMSAADAEKQALLEKFSGPSGVVDEERMKRAAAIIHRAVSSGLTEVMVAKFPKELFTDGGRAINQTEPGWENTLTGLPKELYDFWKKHLQPRGYKLRFQVVDYPGGIPGDVGMNLSWL